MGDDLGTLADQLYALAADDFVAGRDAQVKRLRADGDRDLAAQVGALPRPTVAAWLLNQLTRRRAAAVAELVGLGAELREAQQSLDGDQMRTLTRQRQQVVRAFSRQVAQLADELGRPVSSVVEQQVEETLRAAVADERAGHALLSGRLTTALSYVGMGEVSAAVAVPRAPRPTLATSSVREEDERVHELAAARERRREAGRHQLAQAEEKAEQAAEAMVRRDQEILDLTDRLSRLHDRLAALRAEVAQAEAEAADIATAQQDALARRTTASQDEQQARGAADRARLDLGGLDGP